MSANDKARELEDFLKKAVPTNHEIDLMGTGNEPEWLQAELRKLPPDERSQPPEVKSYVFLARTPEHQLSVRVNADDLENLPPETIWNSIEALFPLSENMPAEVTVVRVGEHAELLSSP